jgi:phosphatidate cytidylyltransferase
VTRVLSGAVLILIAVAAVWFAPALLFQALALALVVIAAHELVGLARASGLHVPAAPTMAAAALTLVAVALPPGSGDAGAALPVILLAQVLALGGVAMGRWRPGTPALAGVAASLFPSLYVALPVGALVVIRDAEGPAALFLLMVTVMASDTAQYYSGRVFGRRPLAPVISPAKTVEGAIGGFVIGTAVFAIAGGWWLSRVPPAMRLVFGIAIVASGIAGDLFESMLKRSAGVKDSSRLIPGHGGVLDRIDALIFAGPTYYIILTLV